MKADVYTTIVARGVVASAIAGISVMPQTCSAGMTPVTIDGETAFPGLVSASPVSGCVGEDTISLHFAQPLEEWPKDMESEFRKLALGEATGILTADQLKRLDVLSITRDRLHNPRSPDEVLLQLQRDRVLADITEALKQYVEFQQAASDKRPSAR